MAEFSVTALKKGLNILTAYESGIAEEIRTAEEKADHYEDILGTYLVKLSRYQVSDSDSSEISKLLKAIGDIDFTPDAKKELEVLCSAVSEILTLSYTAFVNGDMQCARNVEPLEQVIDGLKTKLRDGHIKRLKNGECSIEMGFVWSDLITNLERTADHCSNIAACVIDAAENNMNMHQSVREMKENNEFFNSRFAYYKEKYAI